MRNLLVLFVLLIGLSLSAQTNDVYRCGAQTTKGTECKIRVKEMGAKCHHHSGADATKSVFLCGATTIKGKPCKRKVKSQGAKCYSHQ